jgi:hypothetical protein
VRLSVGIIQIIETPLDGEVPLCIPDNSRAGRNIR